jgi:predicted tellurium resistance membrane protein TerC
MDTIGNMTPMGFWVHAGVIGVGVMVSIVSFAFLIPLDSVPAVTGVTIIMAVAYCISVLLWLIVVKYYSSNMENLVWLNTNIMFLIVLPATIGATAMNVTAVQNTRNLLAGQVTG